MMLLPGAKLSKSLSVSASTVQLLLDDPRPLRFESLLLVTEHQEVSAAAPPGAIIAALKGNLPG